MEKEELERHVLDLIDTVDTLTQALRELQSDFNSLQDDFDAACSDTYGFITGDF